MFKINTFFFFYTLFFSSGCNNSSYSIERVEMTTKIPERIINNKGVTYTMNFFVSCYKEYVIYEFPYHQTKEINDLLIYDSTKYEYFIYNKNSEFGYMLKNFEDSFSIRLNKDSVISSKAYSEQIKSEDFFKEVKIKSNNYIQLNKRAKISRYILTNNFYDSAYFYFDDNLKNIKFSLSRKLDSINDSKLFKILLFLKIDTLAILPNKKDFFINSFEISKKQVSEEIKELFDRFIKEEKQNKHS